MNLFYLLAAIFLISIDSLYSLQLPLLKLHKITLVNHINLRSISNKYDVKLNNNRFLLHMTPPAAPSDSVPTDAYSSPLIIGLNKLLARCSWVAWWIQIVLTVISFVILSFANAVRSGAGSQVLASGFFLSSIGVLVSFINAFSTWNFTRLPKRVALSKMRPNAIIENYRKYAKISCTISLIGMFITLLGAEQIVGTLASKVLSSQSLFLPQAGIVPGNTLQALDIFLVQANTNCLASHFAPLAIYTWFQAQLPNTIIESVPAVKAT